MDRYYVDRTLTQVAVGRKRPTFLAERLLPVVYHEQLTGKYWDMNASQDAALITQATQRAPTASPHSMYEKAPTLSDFTIEDHALQTTLADEYRSPEAALLGESNKINKLVDAIDLGKEVRMLTTLQAGLYNATAPTEKFDAASPTKDPLDYILSLFPIIEDAKGASPNVLALDVKTARAIINHPMVKERGLPTMGPDRYNTGIDVMEGIIASILGLDEVMIASGSIRNIARKNETANITRTWGDNMVLGIREEPSLEYSGMGIIAKWAPPEEEGSEVVNGKLVQRERLDNFRQAWAFAVHDYHKMLITSLKGGIWIPDTLT